MKRFLIILAVLGANFTQAQTPKTPAGAKTEHAHAAQTNPAENTIDPVCKMSISKDTRSVSTHKGKKIGFCSVVCKERFDKNPAKYAVK
ncbi:YHS domain-containing protein [Pseudarcicella hirudinis]|uniref:YHS domain-containing protein n=1 Tax=Pseudarcicella hirudinis TaxID=1079859 RepID=A0A1I5VBP6_9BACT|nr:YHS domain-containing protein [Pseudarcicella hirudinis]SFQ04933.1 YHS domain-containing protein [Pseudarcicella hirudinis]